MELLKEISREGAKGFRLPPLDVEEVDIKNFFPEKFLRDNPPPLPEVSEPEVIRHFVNLSSLNYHVDRGFYPLGSCTMKYNPRINEEMASLEGFTNLHPLQPDDTVQGALELIYNLQDYLGKLTGFKHVSLHPAAGAHGELLGLLLIRAYHKKHGNHHKKKILIPDSAHGTNPASCTRAGFVSVKVTSGEKGILTPDILEKYLDDEVAGLMLTNPNTLGLFETYIVEMAEMLHEKDALLYMDGANLNALMGYFYPGKAGVDILHYNLHKTFSTPHGGGGPGGGGVGVSERVEPFLPVPRIEKGENGFYLDYNRPDSIGKIISFYGHFNVMIKALTYIIENGPDGLKKVTETAVINANYLMTQLKDTYNLPYDTTCMHEFVLSGNTFKKYGVRTLDIAKRILDHNMHAPTIYFPLIVPEALMIEPTETEPRWVLDRFISVMKKIAKEAAEDPELLKKAPQNTPVKRLDEAKAVRELDVHW